VTAADGAAIKVSVVIPVYNTRPYLAECLDSVLAQDLPPSEFEVIAVDDGSTDGSAELLDHYCALHQNIRVVHQDNSGWPGRPRNVGRAASRGAYVFFADSDDCLAPEALRRMYDFAVAHGSDVVVPKNVPLDGTGRPSRLWRKTQVNADLTGVIQTLGPWKLFRREFLDEQGLWFPEGRTRLEDGIFVTEAYLTARRVSLLADYAYYLKRVQPDGGNISSSPVDPDGYTSSIARMIETIRRRCADDSTADTLVTTLYRRKALKWFAPDRFPSYQPAHREAWVQAVRNLQDAHVSPDLDDLLPLAYRTRSVLVRHGEVAALVSLGAAQRDGRPLRAVLVRSWVELQVPGLVARPALVIAPGLRLVPAEESSARVLVGALMSIAGHRVRAVARRTSWGREALIWARNRHGDRRSG
jgi:poly(ribitol-phosphate) beta-N-acetylglucosaminyltransferase